MIGTQPLPGHFRPLIPLAKGLVDRGHEVLFTTSGFYSEAIEEHGFRVRPVGPYEPLALEKVTNEMTRTSTEAHDADVLVLAGQTARAALADVVHTAREWRPDVVVRDSAEFATYVAAELLKIPHVNISTSLATSLYSQRTRFTGAVNELRRDVGLNPDPTAESLFGLLNLEFMVPSFFTGDDETPPNTRFLRQSTPGSHDAVPSILAGLPEERTVLVNFGTLAREPHALVAICRALRPLPINLLVKTAHQDLSVLERFASDRVRVSCDLSPASVLPSCDLFITHAGFNGVKESLRAGVPMLTNPLFGDQFFISHRCQELGLAVPLEATNATEVRTTIERALVDSEMRESVLRVCREMMTLPTVSEGVVMVEKAVSSASRKRSC